MSLVWQDPESRAKPKPEAPCPLFEQAHARKSDPVHSHEAAKSIVNIGPVREKILHILGNCPRSDEDIWARYQFCMEKFNWPPCSPSGLRSRRSELVKLGFVVETGTGVTASGRKCAIWRIK